MKLNLEDASVIDVRTPAEYAEEHYPGAVNIPVDKIQFQVDEIKNMKAPIVLYCKSGTRSAHALKILKENGLNEVYNVGGLYDILKVKVHEK
jgi:phage shock protein E